LPAQLPSQINIELFGWSIGSLVFVALILFCGKLRSGDYLMLALAASVVGLYNYYRFSGGPDFGALLFKLGTAFGQGKN
jgi:hypothetical protein